MIIIFLCTSHSIVSNASLYVSAYILHNEWLGHVTMLVFASFATYLTDLACGMHCIAFTLSFILRDNDGIPCVRGTKHMHLSRLLNAQRCGRNKAGAFEPQQQWGSVLMRCSRYLRDAPASQPTRFTNYFNHCIHPCLSKSSAYFKCHEEMPFQLIHLWLTYFSCKPLHSISVHPAILSKLMVQLQAGGYCTRMRSKTTK